MKEKSNFWPLDYDTEDEIYDNLSWDLPGLRRRTPSAKPRDKQKPNSMAATRMRPR